MPDVSLPREYVASKRNVMHTFLADLNTFLAVNSIALVKPEKAQAVENMLIQMAKSGRLPGKVCSLCPMTVITLNKCETNLLAGRRGTDKTS